MTYRAYEDTVFTRLSTVRPAAIIALMNNPRVRKHLPLARGHFGPTECREFLVAKERLWQDFGYGPWGFLLDEEFIGWGGVQREGQDADVGLVLHPRHWGAGRTLITRSIAYAFGELGLDTVTTLLPLSRTRVTAILRLGFGPDGTTLVNGTRFNRYRLDRTASLNRVASTPDPPD